MTIRLSHSVLVWANGAVLAGGSPWGVSRLAPAVQDLVRRLEGSGAAGITISNAADARATRVLLDRGYVESVAPDAPDDQDSVTVIPAYECGPDLGDLLSQLGDDPIVVVDDASPDAYSIAAAVHDTRARLLRLDVNQGPGAARNVGFAATDADFVAFIDSDCLPGANWYHGLLHHFADPKVSAVAARIVPVDAGRTVLEKYEEVGSSLDMGPRAELVRPGARLGFVPSAAIVIRRSAFDGAPFDPSLRLGEDVDLVWRMGEAGWIVRYDPTVEVGHRTRSTWRQWLSRRFDYGTSAPSLDHLHPGLLTPARLSPFNVAAVVLISRGHSWLALVSAAVPIGLLAVTLDGIPLRGRLATRIAAQGAISDAVAIGRALRREWWPLGILALVAAPRSRTARIGTSLMVAPVLWDYMQLRPRMDPVTYTGVRLADDAAYGTGVLAASISSRSFRHLVPSLTSPVTALSAAVRRIATRRRGGTRGPGR